MHESNFKPGNDKKLEGVKVLVVDDEEVLAWSIATELQKVGAEVKKAVSAAGARVEFDQFIPDVVVCDLKLPDGNGLDLLKEWHHKIPTLPVILITAHGGVETAISAVQLSAFDYLQKPFNMKALTAAVVRASEVSWLRQKVSRLEGAVKGRDPVRIIGNSDPIRQLHKRLKQVANSGTDTVLVYGETGSGKELAARAVHEWSNKADKPYIEINCASIPETLLESELFGYEKGAFTDARARKLGLFEMAKDGTIFLDEIGEMPLSLQSKLLRALEYRRFRRLGGVKDIEFTGTIVAATNRSLLDEIAAGRFRADLYYRLNVVPLHIAPLRDRKSDIGELTEFFLKKICKKLNRQVPRLAPETIDLLKQHDWPGNVRELMNTLHRSLVFEASDTLEPRHIEIERLSRIPERPQDDTGNGSIPRIVQSQGATQADVPAEAGIELPARGIKLEDVEKSLLEQAMDRTHNNQSKAADLLGITRHVLRYRLEKHGLS